MSRQLDSVGGSVSGPDGGRAPLESAPKIHRGGGGEDRPALSEPEDLDEHSPFIGHDGIGRPRRLTEKRQTP